MTEKLNETVAQPQDVLTFWRDAGPQTWWRKDDDFDQAIEEKFLATLVAAAMGRLDHWTKSADSALALIIVLDQFSRNLFRNSPRAFAQDAKALQLTKQMMASGLDTQLERSKPEHIGTFCYLPLMHSEVLRDQQVCLKQMQALGLEGNIKAAEEHLDIIKRFGRFPHRNAVLGRKTTPEEQAFLDGGGFSG